MRRAKIGWLIGAVLACGLLTGCGTIKEPLTLHNPNGTEIIEEEEVLEDIVPDDYIEGMVTDSPFQYVEESDTVVKVWEEYRPLYNGTHCLECETENGALYIETEAEFCTYGEDGICTVCGFNPETDLIRTVYEKIDEGRHRCIMYQNNAVLYDYEEDCFLDIDGVCILCHQ